jgi:hypothetical protein
MKIGSFFGRFSHPPIPRFAIIMLFALAYSSFALCRESHNAVRQGELAKYKIMLKENPKLDLRKDEVGSTYLDMAISEDQNDVVELLLAHGAAVNVKGDNGWTPFLRYMLIKSLQAQGVQAWNSPINPYTPQPPLHHAVMQGNKYVVELLLAHGAEVNARFATTGTMPLHEAANDKDLVELLLAHGAEVNAKDAYGVMPLHFAVNKEAAEILRRHGGREYGYSPIALRLGMAFLLLLAASLCIFFLILRRMKHLYLKNYYRYAISFFAVTTAFVYANVSYYFPRLFTIDEGPFFYTNYGGPFVFCFETPYVIGFVWKGLLLDVALVLLASGLIALFWKAIGLCISK